jgi:4-amino-4-deoxy-L-arabinose transferase-like glycosyltransferase
LEPIPFRLVGFTLPLRRRLVTWSGVGLRGERGVASARESIIAENQTLSRNADIGWKLVALLVITGLAAFFRLYRINSLPPGDRYDPAFYGVDALRVLSGERPVFFYDWVGQHKVEPLFSYLVALCFLAVGPSTLGIHLAAAIVGIATVPAVYLVADTLFRTLPAEEGVLRRWGALMAALVMAISYWHLTWSRYGVRAILVPLFAALVVTSLWRGLGWTTTDAGRSLERRWPFVGCGILLGASMYTYQAARLLPALVVVGFAVVAWHRRRLTRHDLMDLVIVACVALVVFAPLGLYFVRHPDSFSSRVEQVVVIDESQGVLGNARSVLRQVWRTALSFAVGVDEEPYRTLPGRPSLSPVFAVLLLIGISFSMGRVREPAHMFLLAWLFLMVVPAALAEEGAAAKRAIGALPAVAMLIAEGVALPLESLRRWAAARPAWRWPAALWGAVVVGGFLYGGWATYRDYFVKWASLPGLFTHFEVARAAIGEYAGDLPPGERIYVSPEVPSHPVIRFHSGLRDDIEGYNGRVCLVIPERTSSSTTYIIAPKHDPHSLDLLESYLPDGRVVDKGGWHRGEPSFVAFRIPAGSEAHLPAMDEVRASWAAGMELLGYRINGDSFQTGDKIELTLYYRSLEEAGQRYTAFVHLLGPDNPASGGPLWAQNDSEPCNTFYPTSSWSPGEIIVDRIDLVVPGEAPSGTYRLTMGFYEPWSGQRLHAEGNSVTEHDVVLLGEVRVEAPPED